MTRIRVALGLVFLALVPPVVVLASRALEGLALEREVQQRALAERVFDEMERTLSDFLREEEARPAAYYRDEGSRPARPFVVGYFEVDPDGRLRAPRRPRDLALERRLRTAWLESRRAPPAPEPPPPERPRARAPELALKESSRAGAPMYREKPEKTQEVTTYDLLQSLNVGAQEREERQRAALEDEAPSAPEAAAEPAPEPLVGRAAGRGGIVLHRTVWEGARATRQGLLLDRAALGRWLVAEVIERRGLAGAVVAGFGEDPTPGPGAVFRHRFAEPFDALSLRLALAPLPGAGSATPITLLAALVLVAGSLGLLAVDRMVKVVVEFAERRASFVAAVSHELKTPLAAIRMYAEMLRDDLVPSEARRRDYYRTLTDESERLSRLIGNVLEFSRLEKGNRELRLVTSDLAACLAEAAERLRPHAEREGFSLQVEVEPGLPALRLDRDALVQVLFNLVDNATKYARDGGRREIVIEARRHRGQVTLAVRDFGPGVPPRQLARIFEPFYRAERELTRRAKGTGIGLALVKELAERMGAAVRGANAVGGGLRVELAWPTPA
jgi:signal transduction histidine kinase